MEDMENFFKQIEDEEKINKLKFFKRKSLSEGKTGSKKEINREQKKYAEKVKSYSKYLIGRKLSKNIQSFSSVQVEEGNIISDNSALMRILTKWCQELDVNFSSIKGREEFFRTEDDRKEYLPGWKLVTLDKLLSHEQQNISKYMKKLLMNNYEHQS